MPDPEDNTDDEDTFSGERKDIEGYEEEEVEEEDEDQEGEELEAEEDPES